MSRGLYGVQIYLRKISPIDLEILIGNTLILAKLTTYDILETRRLKQKLVLFRPQHYRL